MSIPLVVGLTVVTVAGLCWFGWHLDPQRRGRALKDGVPSWHPDRDTFLDETETEAFERIEAGLEGRNSAGVDIFSSDEEG